MTTESTPDSQQSNPGVAVAATDTANPTATQGTAPVAALGQGAGGASADTPATPAAAGTVPEAYAFEVPEGFTLEGERLEMATSVAKELGLDGPRAQKLVDAYVKLAGADASTLPAKLLADPAALEPVLEQARLKDSERWAAETKAELGDQYDATVAFAKTAVQAINSPKLLEEFNRMGWGNNPELVKAFAFFGRTLRDSPIDGIGSATTPTTSASIESRMYPGMARK